MSNRLELTLACGDYESVRALKEGTVEADGIRLNVLTDMDSSTRHWRMVRNREFDICELSLSTYLMAFDRGHPLIAIPVFLHRRFRHGFMFVNAAAGIDRPEDLRGRRIGIKTFQTTAILWMRGMLEHQYGVPQTEVRWVSEIDEDIAFTPAEGLSIERAPAASSVEWMLADGELDAVFHADLIDPIVQGDTRVRRLFENYREVELDYYRRTGIFPIMHVTAIRAELVERHPWLAVNLMRAFEQSKQAAYARLENPRVVPLAWYRSYLDEERQLLGPDPWQYGLGERNRNNLATAIGYSHGSGLIGREIPVDELFVEAALGGGRGVRKRI